jgi:protein AaeX
MRCRSRLKQVKTMPVEIDILGFFAPILLLVFVGCIGVFVVLDLLLARIGIYRLAWHPGLFRLALFVVLFCGVALVVQKA